MCSSSVQWVGLNLTLSNLCTLRCVLLQTALEVCIELADSSGLASAHPSPPSQPLLAMLWCLYVAAHCRAVRMCAGGEQWVLHCTTQTPPLPAPNLLCLPSVVCSAVRMCAGSGQWVLRCTTLTHGPPGASTSCPWRWSRATGVW
jgi:hypothetical protein